MQFSYSVKLYQAAYNGPNVEDLVRVKPYVKSSGPEALWELRRVKTNSDRRGKRESQERSQARFVDRHTNSKLEKRRITFRVGSWSRFIIINLSIPDSLICIDSRGRKIVLCWPLSLKFKKNLHET